MKVLHIIARFNVGGTASWLSTLSKELIEAGNSSIIVTGNVKFPEIESVKLERLPHFRIPELGRTLRFSDDIRSFFKLRNLMREINPDIVNTHTAKAGVLGRLAALSLGYSRPAIVHTIHGHLLTGYFGKLKVRLVILVESFLARYSDFLLFAGMKVQEDCIQAGIGTYERSCVVKPGVEVPSEIGKSFNDTGDFPRTGKIRVGWLARVTAVKRPERVIEVALRLPEIDFVIGGEGELLSPLSKIAPKNCHFLGWVSPKEFWQSVDIALLTSDNEAMPISIIEAQLQGLPCVATNAGSTAEVVLDGVNGFVTDMSIDALSEKIAKLASDEGLRKNFGMIAKTRAIELFSPKSQLSDHLKAYEMALEIRKRSRP
jgi:glycosyltransferase involved in cell wall biosynthesis